MQTAHQPAARCCSYGPLSPAAAASLAQHRRRHRNTPTAAAAAQQQQPECLAQMSSEFNPAISVWSVPDQLQFPAEMRGAVILTLDDSGAFPAQPQGYSVTRCACLRLSLLQTVWCACRECAQPVPPKRQHLDWRVLVSKGTCVDYSLTQYTRDRESEPRSHNASYEPDIWAACCRCHAQGCSGTAASVDTSRPSGHPRAGETAWV